MTDGKVPGPPATAADVDCPACYAGKGRPCTRTRAGMSRAVSTWDFCRARRARFLRSVGMFGGPRERR